MPKCIHLNFTTFIKDLCINNDIKIEENEKFYQKFKPFDLLFVKLRICK